jgi:hypothetical protein
MESKLELMRVVVRPMVEMFGFEYVVFALFGKRPAWRIEYESTAVISELGTYLGR